MDELLTTEDLARICGVPIGTIYRWNHLGTGPTRIRVGKHLRYRKEVVDAWFDKRTAENTDVKRAS